MRLRRIVPFCLLLVFLGAVIGYSRSERKDTVLRPLEKEELKAGSDVLSRSGEGTDILEKSEIVTVPDQLLGAAGAVLSPQAAAADLGSPLVRTGERDLGTARFIGGKTILISVFVNNTRYEWDFSDQNDVETYSRLYHRLQTASEWVEAQAESYNVDSDIVWDWYNNEDLYYVTDADSGLDGAMDSLYAKVSSWIRANVDVEKLVSEYDADNVIFMYYVNSDPDEEQRSFAFQSDFYSYSGREVIYEGVWFNIGHCGYIFGAPSLAHEILHCFGAVDLYYSNDQITDEYVNYLSAIGSEDIMYMVYDEPDEVNEQFTELDAYYVGLTSYSSDAERFGLGKSAHLQ